MRRGWSLAAALVPLLVSLPILQARAGSGTLVIPPGTWLCPGNVDPSALGSALDAQAGGFAGSCTAQCLQARQGLFQAFLAACAAERAQALSSAARVAQQLERTGPVSDFQRGLLSQLVEAADAAVAGARDGLDADVALLCASARAQQGRVLAGIDHGIDRAGLALASGSASGALQELARALQGIESAEKSIAANAAGESLPSNAKLFASGAAPDPH